MLDSPHTNKSQIGIGGALVVLVLVIGTAALLYLRACRLEAEMTDGGPGLVSHSPASVSIHLGMSKPQVKQILGPPQKQYPPNALTWRYHVRGWGGNLYISFNVRGRVIAKIANNG